MRTVESAPTYNNIAQRLADKLPNRRIVERRELTNQSPSETSELTYE